jgi:hypothetical protein
LRRDFRARFLGTRDANGSRKQQTRPGARVVKPKKASLIQQNKIKHKSSSGLIGQTEKLMAEKAGHLELLKGGKKDKKEAKKTK